MTETKTKTKQYIEPLSWAFRVGLSGKVRTVRWYESDGFTIEGVTDKEAKGLLVLLMRVDEQHELRNEPGEREVEADGQESGERTVLKPARREAPASPPLVFDGDGPPRGDPIAIAIERGTAGAPISVNSVSQMDAALADLRAKSEAVGGNSRDDEPEDGGQDDDDDRTFWAVGDAYGLGDDDSVVKVTEHGDGGCLLVLASGVRVKLDSSGNEVGRVEGEPLKEVAEPDPEPSADDLGDQDDGTEVDAAGIADVARAVDSVTDEVLGSLKIRTLVNHFLDAGLERADVLEACVSLAGKAKCLQRKKDPRTSVETCLAGMGL